MIIKRWQPTQHSIRSKPVFQSLNVWLIVDEWQCQYHHNQLQISNVLQLLLDPTKEVEQIYYILRKFKSHNHTYIIRKKETLLKSVAESTVIFFPILQLGCFNASATLTSFSFSTGQSLLIMKRNILTVM